MLSIVDLQLPSENCINSEVCAVDLYKNCSKVFMIKSLEIPLLIADNTPGAVSI